MTADSGADLGDVRLDRRLARLILRAATEFADPLGGGTAAVVDDLLKEVSELFAVQRTRLWLQDPGARRIVPAAAVYQDEAASLDLPIELRGETVERLEAAIDEYSGLVPLGPLGPVPELSFNPDGGVGVLLGLCVPVRPGLDRGGLLTMCGVARPPRGPEESGAVVALGRMLVGAIVGDEVRQRNEVIQETAGIGVVLRDPKGRLLEANDAYCEMIGRSREDLIGRTLDGVVTGLSAEVIERARSDLSQGLSGVVDVEFVVGEGSDARTLIGHAQPVRLPDGTVRYTVGVTRDVTGERRAEAALRASEARHRDAARLDALTGLLNRGEFTERLDDRLGEPSAPGSCRALLLVDLDRFKHINDSMGHRTGDAVLTTVTERLKASVADDSLVGRIGGDEFLVLVELDGGSGAVDALSHALRSALEEPMILDEREVLTSVSIGVALATGDVDADELVHAADLAVYAAKSAGRNRVVVHDAELEARIGLRSTLETELRGAVSRGELVVAYQPEVDLVTRALVGVEALVRWDHPDRGRLGAADFVEIAEGSGLLVEIGEYALRRAWEDLSSWPAPPADFRCRVNLSAVQLASALDVLALLDELELSGPALHRLCLELTETALLAEPDVARGVLESLRARGVSVAIDDFGTGYGGFTYVKSFPVDVLKIDRLFVTDVAEDPYDRAIVEAIVGLARSLDLDVSAEGIESQAQAEALTAMGCRRGQGYLYGSAIPADEVGRMLAAGAGGADDGAPDGASG